MESIVIGGPKPGQSMEVEYETYQEMKALYMETVVDEEADPTDWFYEGRFFFETWLYEELNGLKH